jgi:hypothetical protein
VPIEALKNGHVLQPDSMRTHPARKHSLEPTEALPNGHQLQPDSIRTHPTRNYSHEPTETLPNCYQVQHVRMSICPNHIRLRAPLKRFQVATTCSI